MIIDHLQAHLFGCLAACEGFRLEYLTLYARLLLGLHNKHG